LVVASGDFCGPGADVVGVVGADAVGGGGFAVAVPESCGGALVDELDAVAFGGGARGFVVLDPFVSVVVAGA
jgi:hypothetical protein